MSSKQSEASSVERTVGEHEVTMDENGVYQSKPPKPITMTELSDPPTSEAARAHGLRRIKRRHLTRPFSELREKIDLTSQLTFGENDRELAEAVDACEPTLRNLRTQAEPW